MNIKASVSFECEQKSESRSSNAIYVSLVVAYNRKYI